MMKRILYLIVIQMFMFSAKAHEPCSHIVGSYNIRCYTIADTGDKEWNQRKSFLFDLIRECNFDVCGLEEVTDIQTPDIISNLPAYEYIGYGRDNGKENANGAEGEQTGLMYKTARYEKQAQGRFFFIRHTSILLKNKRICIYSLGCMDKTKRQKIG